MQLTGLLHGAPLLKHVDFPTAEVLGPDAAEDQIQDLIRRHGQVFVKPLFKGGDRQEGQGRPDRPRHRPRRARWPRRSASTSPSTGTATSRPRPTA